MSFASDVEEYCDLYEKRTEDVVKIVCYEVSNQIISRTPVDTGRARGNWKPSLNREILKQFSGKDKTGKKGLERVVKTTARIKIGDVFYLTNNLPYIRRLEYGLYNKRSRTGKTVAGFSKQAPMGMLRISIRNYRRALRKAIRKARRENK